MRGGSEKAATNKVVKKKKRKKINTTRRKGRERKGGGTEQSGGSLECGKLRVDAHAASQSLPPSFARSHIHMLARSPSLQQSKLISWSQR